MVSSGTQRSICIRSICGSSAFICPETETRSWAANLLALPAAVVGVAGVPAIWGTYRVSAHHRTGQQVTQWSARRTAQQNNVCLIICLFITLHIYIDSVLTRARR